MKSIYRCTILIYILLSQLDLFTSVEGAALKAASVTPVPINMDNKKTTAFVNYENKNNRSRFTCKTGFAIKELKTGGQLVWEAKDGKYPDRVVVVPKADGKPKFTVFYSGQDDNFNEGDSDEEEASEAESEDGKITAAQLANHKAKAASAKTAAKPAAKAKAGPAASTGGKTLDIPLGDTSAEEVSETEEGIIVVEQKRSSAAAPKSHVVHATAARATPAQAKFAVSTPEAKKAGTPAAPSSSAKKSKAAFMDELRKMAEDMKKEYDQLSAEVERRKTGAPAPPMKVEEIHVVDSQPPQAAPAVDKKDKPKYVTSVEVVQRQPKATAQPATSHVHLPAEIQAAADAAMSGQVLDGTQRGVKVGTFEGDKIDLLHHKVDRVYSEVAVLRHDFARLHAKFDAFLSTVSTGGSLAAAGAAAASTESRPKHGQAHGAKTSGDDLITGYQLASEFPTGWHDHNFTRTGITVDLTSLPTGNTEFEVKDHGDILTLLFNKGKTTDELLCAGASVWSFHTIRGGSKHPLSVRFNRKTLKILVNFADYVNLYEKDSDGKWKEAKDFKLTGVDVVVKTSDVTTAIYGFTADAAAKKYTYEAKDGNAFKNVKHGGKDVWKTDSLLEYADKVELREYVDDMLGVTVHLLDRSSLKFIKESSTADWKFADPTKVTAATVDIFSNADTYSYTIESGSFGVKSFVADTGFKFNKVIAKHATATKVVCETQNELNFANKVDFDAMGATRKVTLHIGVGTSATTRVFEEGPDGWKAQGSSSTPTPATSLTATPPTATSLTATPPTATSLTATPPTATSLTATPPTATSLTATPPTATPATATPATPADGSASTPPATPATNGTGGVATTPDGSASTATPADSAGNGAAAS
ncbi:hypothetical protein MACJ_001678 [Theileria orientalis]|uniref:SfiI-subtelomeric related protein family member n=1 Tax=Theileria orientalis TaxID=68886 RepID=A0A976MAL4_THEOR|nr:hypothetical protein MACJ_001678 [Theileria orientalis]